MRAKRRYFLLEIIPDSQAEAAFITTSNIYSSIHKIVNELHGDFGVATIMRGLKCSYLNTNTRIAIIRADRGPHRFVATALPFVMKIGNITASYRLLHLGGSIRSCNKFLLSYHQKQLLTAYRQCTNEASRKQLQELFSTTPVTINWTI